MTAAGAGPTKAELAARWGVDVRTVERTAARGKIGAQRRRGFPTRYNPVDVARFEAERRTDATSGVLTEDPTSKTNGNGALAHPRPGAGALEELASQFLQAALRALAGAPTGPTGPTTGPTSPTLTPEEREAQYVTLPEAAAIKGLSETHLRKAIVSGKLPGIKDRGWKVRRRDLKEI